MSTPETEISPRVDAKIARFEEFVGPEKLEQLKRDFDRYFLEGDSELKDPPGLYSMQTDYDG